MENKSTDEISLKRAVDALFGEWKVIAIFTAAALIIASIYVFAIAKPVYASSISGIINTTQTVENKYGEYTFPTTNIADYIQIAKSDRVLNTVIHSLKLETTVEEFKSHLTVSSDSTSNKFTITATSETSDGAIKLAEEMLDAYKTELMMKYRKAAVDFFLEDITLKNDIAAVDLEKETKKQEALEEKLSEISPLITLKTILTTDPDLATQIAYENGLDLSNITDDVALREFVNPYYTEMKIAILKAMQKVNTVKIDMEENTKLYEELLAETDRIEEYYKTGKLSESMEESLNVLQSKITVLDADNISASIIAPRKKFILGLAFILGLMLGILGALVKHYWKYK